MYKKVVLAENGHKTIFELTCAVSISIIESVRKASVWRNQISNRFLIWFVQAEIRLSLQSNLIATCSVQCSFARLSSSQLSFAQPSFAQLSFARLSPANPSSLQLRALQLRSAQTRSAQPRSAQPRSAHTHSGQPRSAQLRLAQLRPVQFRQGLLEGCKVRSISKVLFFATSSK